MSTKLVEEKAVFYNYLKDWRKIDGRWVFVPLHDPIKSKLNKGFRNMVVANALREASKLVSSKFEQQVGALAKEYAGSVSAGLIAGWEEGDPWCPDNWPWHHFPGGGGPDPDPDPVYHATAILATIAADMPAMVKQELVGFTVQRIGEMVGDKSIIALGKEMVQVNAMVG